MIRVIGNRGCSRCEMTKQILNNKGIEYEYMLLSDLPAEEQNVIMTKAQEEKKIALPIIIKDDKLVDVKEI